MHENRCTIKPSTEHRDTAKGENDVAQAYRRHQRNTGEG